MLPGLLVTVTVGTWFTVTFRVLVLIQPAVVPVTLYVVETVGVAVVVPEVMLIGFQL
jgi:hypothetical protein